MKFYLSLSLAFVLAIVCADLFSLDADPTAFAQEQATETSQAEDTEQSDDNQGEDDEAEEGNEDDDEKQELVVEVIAEGLSNPCGVAIQPDTGTVFVSDSGALRVVRIVDNDETDSGNTDEDGGSGEDEEADKNSKYKIEEVIIGFPGDELGTDPKLEVGPLGLAFLNSETLLVAGNGNKEGEEQLRVYSVPESGTGPLNFDGTAVEEESVDSEGEGNSDEDSDEDDSDEDDSVENSDDEMVDDEDSDDDESDAEMMDDESMDVAEEASSVQELTLDSDEDQSEPGDFFSVLARERSVFVTSNGDDGKGWLAKADVVEDKLANFSRKFPTSEKTGTAGPTAVVRSPDGFIVVAQMGSTDTPNDSKIAFYDESGEELGNDHFDTTLSDVTGIAYGPTRGRLFAVDLSLCDPENAGLFKLVADTDTGCKAVKIMDLDRPTSMAFDDEGDLYITLLGSVVDSDEPTGKLIRISGLDKEPEPDDEE